MSEPNNPENEPDIGQQLGMSLDFWAMGKEDYPPAIRGVIAEMGDLQEAIQKIVQKIGRDKDYPQLSLKRILWFEDKNGKLDEACEEAKAAFRPYPTSEEGLIDFKDPNNPMLKAPTRHRLAVSEEFASTNYDRPDEDQMILDDDDDDSEMGDDQELDEKSWKRKITQTLKPWSISEGGKAVSARPADDLMETLNAILSKTKHGWLVADMFKLKKRRGAVLTYARTFEYQRADGKAFEFKVELFGAAAEYRSRLGKTLMNVGAVYLDVSSDGEIYVTKVSNYSEQEWSDLAGEKEVVIPLMAQVVSENGKPSQLVLKKTGAYFESRLKPLLEKGSNLSTKIDLKKSNSEDKKYCFHLQVELDGPLLVASSGNAVIFQLDDMLLRFANTNLANIRASVQ
jgi:hypothetical protein